MNIGILLSGGMGTRIESDVPKQYIKVNERRIIDYSLTVHLIMVDHNRGKRFV